MKLFRNPDTIAKPLANYTHQIEIKGIERLLVLSGQTGHAPDGKLPTAPIDQFRESFLNVKRNLEAANMDMSNVVKLTVFLVGEFDIEARRQITKEMLGDHHPCMTLLYVQALATPEIKVEIEALACVDN